MRSGICFPEAAQSAGGALSRVLVVCIALLSWGCEPEPRLQPLAGDATVLAFGDSLTFGTGVSAEHSYPAVLAGLIDRRVIRSGIPGETSAQGLERLDKVLREHEPDLVILCHGGNDVLRRLPSAATERNLRAMVAMIRGRGAEVVLLAVPRFGLFLEPLPLYERIATDLVIPADLDIITDLETEPAMKSDTVHFNQAGYRRLAESVQELLVGSGAI